MEKELVLLVGIQFVGKTDWAKENYFGKGYQIVSYDPIRMALATNKIQPEQSLYPVVSTMAKSFMLQELPVLVNGNNITLESLHIWKKICFDYEYKFKVVFFDKPLEEALKVMKERKLENKENTEIIKNNYELLLELKTILNMKHQKIADEVVFVSNISEDKKDEIL
jgi:predicted kinase